MAVVEFARDVLGYKDANSEEFDEAKYMQSNSYYGRSNSYSQQRVEQ